MASPQASDIATTMTEREVRALRKAYQIPSRVQLFLPTGYQRANDFESRRLTINEEMLRVGIRFPFEGLAGGFLRAFGIPPSQMTPNSWRIVRQLELWAREAGVRLTGNSLLHILTMKWSGDFLAVQGRNVKIVGGMPTSNKNWKPRFFFARLLDRQGEAIIWDVPVRWRDNVAQREGTPLSAEEKQALVALRERLKNPIPYTPPSPAQDERGVRAKRPREAAEAVSVSGRASVTAAAESPPKKTVASKRRRLTKKGEAEGVFPEKDTKEATVLSVLAEEERERRAAERREKEDEEYEAVLRESLAMVIYTGGQSSKEATDSAAEATILEVAEATVSEVAEAEAEEECQVVLWTSASERSPSSVIFYEELPAGMRAFPAREPGTPVTGWPTVPLLSEESETFLATASEAILNELFEGCIRVAAEELMSEMAEAVSQDDDEDAAPTSEASDGTVFGAKARDAVTPAAEAREDIAVVTEAVEAATPAAEAVAEATEASPKSSLPKSRRAAVSRRELLARLRAVRAENAGLAEPREATEAAAAETIGAIAGVAEAPEAIPPATKAVDAAVPAAEAEETVAPTARTDKATLGLAESGIMPQGEPPRVSQKPLEEVATSLVHNVKELLRRANEARQSGFKEGRASAEQQAIEITQQCDLWKERAEKAEARAGEAEARADQADERAMELQKDNDHLAQHATNEAEQAVQEKVELLEQKAQEAEGSAQRAELARKEAEMVASVLRGQLANAEHRVQRLEGEASLSAESAAKYEAEARRLLREQGKLNAEAVTLRAQVEDLRTEAAVADFKLSQEGIKLKEARSLLDRANRKAIDAEAKLAEAEAELAEAKSFSASAMPVQKVAVPDLSPLVEDLKGRLAKSEAEARAAKLREVECSADYYNAAVEEIQGKYPDLDLSEFSIKP